MLTKNFYNWVMAKATKMNITNGLVDKDGAVYNNCYYENTNMYEGLFNLLKAFCSYDGAEGVAIGLGTTPATINDYKLESVKISGFSKSNATALAVNADADGVSCFASYSVSNTGTNDLVISEIGLYGRLHNESSTGTRVCLLDRTVLETPITIKPGEAKQLTYTIRMDYPTA